MAASDAKPIPRKNVAHRVYFPIFDADGDVVADGTGLLALVSTDAAPFATAASAASQVSTSSGIYFLDLSASEMNGDAVVAKVTSSTAGAKASVLVMYPQEGADIRVSVTHWDNAPVASVTTAGVPEVDLTFIAGSAVSTTSAQLGVNVVNAAGTAWGSGAITAASIATDAIDADAIAANAVTEIQSGLATAASLTSVNADVVAIKTKTDQLTFTSGAVYSDVVRWDHAPVASVGTAGVPKVDLSHILGSAVSTSTAQLGVNVVNAGGTAWASGSLTSGVFATGAITATAIAADAIGASELASDAITEIQSGLATAASLTSVNADVVAIKTKTDQFVFGTANRVNAQVFGMENGTVTAAAVATGAIDADALAADAVQEFWTATLTQDYAPDNSVFTANQAMYMIWNFLAEKSISGTTLTVKKLDGTTSAMTFTLDSGSAPTSITRAT